MKYAFQLFNILIICLFASCSKEETTIVSGQVINTGSKEPIEGATVTLQDGISSAGGLIEGNTSSGKSASTQTDANGRFSLQITGEHAPALSAGKGDNHRQVKYNGEYIDGGGAAIGVNKGTKNEDVTIELEADAYFYGNFFNVELGNEYDSLKVYFLRDSYSRSGFDYDFSNYDTQEKKAKYDYLCGGHQYLKMELTYLRNGAEEIKIDSVFIESGETFTGTVYY